MTVDILANMLDMEILDQTSSICLGGCGISHKALSWNIECQLEKSE